MWLLEASCFKGFLWDTLLLVLGDRERCPGKEAPKAHRESKGSKGSLPFPPHPHSYCLKEQEPT